MMQAYHNNEGLKSQTILAMKADIKAERLIKGAYWNEEKGNGCFVGCVIRGSAHVKFETVLGIPRILARLGDCLFEGQPYEDAKKFTVDFLKAITPGADLSNVWLKFMHFMLVDKKSGVINFTKHEGSKKAIQAVADLFAKKISGIEVSQDEWLTARRNAADASADADADAADASASAYAAYAADASADAADASADASAYAAYAADASASAADASADASQRSAHYVCLARALIKFLKEAK